MTTTPRKPSSERRREIADAVLRILGERGLNSLTTTAIAGEVGLTSGALFRHFESMDEILIEAVREGSARIDATFPEGSLPPEERLLALARARIRVLGADRGLAWLLTSEQAFLVLPGEAVDLLRDLVRRSRAYVLQALRDGAVEGTFRADIKPEILLVPVMGTIHTLIGGQSVRKLSAGSRPDAEPVLGALIRLLAPPRQEAR